MTKGYSGTPLAKKLGFGAQARVTLLDEPDGFRALLDPLPDGVSFRTSMGRAPDLVVAFFTERARLERRIAALAKAIFPAAGLWIAWPKKASKMATDVDDGVVRAVGLAAGIVDIKVCAIDATWSGLRFAHRRENRPS